MQASELIAATDEEIARLEQARALLGGSGTDPVRRGRPAEPSPGMARARLHRGSGARRTTGCQGWYRQPGATL
jgi:hypothetical protein